MPTANRRRVFLASVGGICMLVAGGPAVAANFQAELSGKHLASGGDPDGWGRVKIRIDDSLNRLCADVETRSLAKVKSVYIFRGPPGDKVSPVVKLDTPDDNDSDDCDNIGDTLADQMQANPADFHVSVQTADYPAGALAGPLTPAGD